MKKVMFMVNSLQGGGAEKILQTLLLNLDKNKYNVTIYSMHRENISILNYPTEISYKVVFDEYIGKNLLRRVWNSIYTKIRGKVFQWFSPAVFYRLVVHEKYDVEVAFIEGESTKIISGSSNPHSKKYAWVHTDLQKNPWTSFLYKNDTDEGKCYKKFDKILCVSESVKRAFLTKFDEVDTDRVRVQYNPINRDEILSMAREKCADYNIREKKIFRMIAVGRLVPQKGFDRLVEVCAKLSECGYVFELLILGEGSERTRLEKMITEMNLSDKVQLLGFVKNPYAVMVTADLLVCSSRSEGFSTVLTEGVVLGLPIISTNCAGVRELFGTRECGQIVDNDSESLYCALKDVLDNPEKLEHYRAESLERGTYFNLSKTMRDIENLLDE